MVCTSIIHTLLQHTICAGPISRTCFVLNFLNLVAYLLSSYETNILQTVHRRSVGLVMIKDKTKIKKERIITLVVQYYLA